MPTTRCRVYKLLFLFAWSHVFVSFMSFCFSNAKLRRASQNNVALFYNYVAYSYGICARRGMCECMRLRSAVPATAFCGGAPQALDQPSRKEGWLKPYVILRVGREIYFLYRPV